MKASFLLQWRAHFSWAGLLLLMGTASHLRSSGTPLPFQQAYMKASNTDASDYLGYSVGISGNTVVVGAPQEDSNSTGVNGNQADNSATNAGAAYIFIRDGTVWKQQAYLKAANAGLNDTFGTSVAISGDTVVIGAPWESSNATGVNGDGSDNSSSQSGAAYIFVRNGTNWTQQAYLKASNTHRTDNFGFSVAISGDTVVVGAIKEFSSATGVNGNQSDTNTPASGAAYVFVRSGTNWSQQAYLKASNPDIGDYFGTSVAVSGDTVVVGAWGESSNATGINGNPDDESAIYAGAAYVFARAGTNWSPQAYLKASNTDRLDNFGISVAISGDTIAVGAEGESSRATGVNGNQSDNSANHAGAVYVFVRGETNWVQQAYLKASNTDANDFFGNSVAISGDTIVVGADEEDSNATGLNGNASDNSLFNPGAAYLFVRNGTNWAQQAYVKASNTGGGNGSTDRDFDAFGASVAVDGDTFVVGAYGEGSNATGVNGDQTNNSTPFAGAAYVFGHFFPHLTIQPAGDGSYFARYDAWPGSTHRLQRAPNVTGPWSDIATNTTPASGLVEVEDTAPPAGQAFYRTVEP